MYKFENFQNMFGNERDTKYLIDMVLHLQSKFKERSVLRLDEMLTTGDSWANMACVDQLCKCGYIWLVEDHEIANFRKYRKGAL